MDERTVMARRVERGAALLDRTEPGWHRRIATDRLAMESCDRCVLGQLHGDFHVGFRAVLATLPSRHLFSAAMHGFTLPDDEPIIKWVAGGADLAEIAAEVEPVILARFAALADLWRDAILARCLAAPTARQ